MMGREGCITATTRSNAKVSSRWRKSTGASDRASVAFALVDGRDPGSSANGAGRGGMLALGPHAAVAMKVKKSTPRMCMGLRNILYVSMLET